MSTVRKPVTTETPALPETPDTEKETLLVPNPPDLWATVPTVQKVQEQLSGQQEPLDVLICKPGKDWFYLHPNTDWRREVYLLRSGEIQKEYYLVSEELVSLVDREVEHYILVPFANRAGEWCLWPAKCSAKSGHLDSFSVSVMGIVAKYPGKWLRIECNPRLKAWTKFVRPKPLPTPADPEGGFRGMFNRAFEGRMLDDEKNPIVTELLGVN
jgi:hypothetical protein